MIVKVCVGGWEVNFDLFGGDSKSDNAIGIYNYIHKNKTSTLSIAKIKNSSFRLLNNSYWHRRIYIPGKKTLYYIIAVNAKSRKQKPENENTIQFFSNFYPSNYSTNKYFLKTLKQVELCK